jgi:hypothetical protein
MTNITVIAALLVSTATVTQALENKKTVCTDGTSTRIIEVAYTGEGALPCEVQYTKSTEVQVLWSAQSSENYCEPKAAEFIEKQKGWGWNCVAEEASEAESTIDTSAPTETTIDETTEDQASQEEDGRL